MNTYFKSAFIALLATASISAANAQYNTNQTVITTPSGVTIARQPSTFINPNYANGYNGTGYGVSNVTPYNPQVLNNQNNQPVQYGAPDINANNNNSLGRMQNSSSSPLTPQEQAILGNSRQSNVGVENTNTNNNNPSNLNNQPNVAVTNLNSGSSVLPGARFRGNPQIIDGATFLLEGQKIALNGVNVPALDQQCNAGKVNYWCGQEAKARLQELVNMGPVVCVTVQDMGNGLVADCSVGFDSLNRIMGESNFTSAFSSDSSPQMQSQRRNSLDRPRNSAPRNVATPREGAVNTSVTPSPSLN